LAAEFLRWDYATVVVDLSEVSSEHSDVGNIKLQDGDVLDVPRTPLGVRVLGSVNYAGEVAWQPGKKLDFYLTEAGGVNKAGWKSRAIIVKARNGSQLRYQNSLSVDPGDVIFVPQKYEASGWEQFKDFVAVTAQVVTVVFVVKNVGK
jgi:protein involved in polysaccharide export with SLBB domain